MIELRTLGEIDVRVNGIVAQPLLSQPKRFALFAYLVIEDVTAHQRDRLMAMFWPELPEARARAALRKTLHHIRRVVGEDMLLNRGDEAIVVDRSGLRCDATALALAIQNADGDNVLRLYRGQFLTGFHVSDASEFHEWVERQRKTYAEGAAKCAMRFARELEACGNAEEAVGALQSTLQITPFDPRVVKAAVDLMTRAGYNMKALRLYAELAGRMEGELGDLHSAATAYEEIDTLWDELERVVAEQRAAIRDNLRRLSKTTYLKIS